MATTTTHCMGLPGWTWLETFNCWYDHKSEYITDLVMQQLMKAVEPAQPALPASMPSLVPTAEHKAQPTSFSMGYMIPGTTLKLIVSEAGWALADTAKGFTSLAKGTDVLALAKVFGSLSGLLYTFMEPVA